MLGAESQHFASWTPVVPTSKACLPNNVEGMMEAGKAHACASYSRLRVRNRPRDSPRVRRVSASYAVYDFTAEGGRPKNASAPHAQSARVRPKQRHTLTPGQQPQSFGERAKPDLLIIDMSETRAKYLWRAKPQVGLPCNKGHLAAMVA